MTDEEWYPVQRSATISADGLYRTDLTRVWSTDPERGMAAWVLCNPSKADGQVDDQSVRKGVGFTRRWGFSSMIWLNFWSFRSTDPWALLKATDPIGPDNDRAFRRVLPLASRIIFAWGDVAAKLPIFKARLPGVLRLCDTDGLYKGRVFCLGRTSSGNPRHPLMLPYSTKLEAFP